MAAFEQKELSGALFKNKKKEKPTHPDYQGSAKINGQEFWVSGWLNKPKAGGDTYVSMTFKSKEMESTGSAAEFEDVDINF